MEANGDYDEMVPDESEQLDQLQPGDSLIDRGVDDILDEGVIAPDNWSPAMGFGNTAAEMRQGETLKARIKQEAPEVVKEPQGPWNPDNESREVGNKRAGRLVDPSRGFDTEDVEAEAIGEDVGFAGGAASAEEAAMHIFDPNEEIDDSDDFQ